MAPGPAPPPFPAGPPRVLPSLLAAAAVAHHFPPPPGGHWPPALPALRCLSVVGRSVRRSPASPAQKLFPDWAFPLCFGNYWLRCLSIKALAHGLCLSPHFYFFFIRPRSLGRTDRSGCQRAPLPLPASLPPPHPFPPGAVCLQAIGSRRRQSRCLSRPGRRFTKWACIERWVPSPDWPSPLPIKRGRRTPAEPQSASRPAHRSARRLVAGRAGGEGERCAASPVSRGGVGGGGGGRKYPYVRAITSPPANQGARSRLPGGGRAGRRARLREPLRLTCPRTRKGGVEAGGWSAAGCRFYRSDEGGWRWLGPRRIPSAGGARAPWPASGDGRHPGGARGRLLRAAFSARRERTEHRSGAADSPPPPGK